MKSDRHCSMLELLMYLTGWALLGACFTVDHDNYLFATLSILGLFALPGVLIVGALGFVIGGRRLFRPAALFGSAVWIVANLIPAINV